MSIYVSVTCHFKNTVLKFLCSGRLDQAVVTSICQKFSLCSKQVKTTALIFSQSQELIHL